MKTQAIILAMYLTSSIAGSALAQEKPANPELLARLEQLASESEQRGRNLTGKPKGLWLLHQARIRNLIDELKAGKSVDPKEVDRLIQEHYR